MIGGMEESGRCRGRTRTRTRWVDVTLKELGLMPQEAKKAARDREEWRRLVATVVRTRNRVYNTGQ